MNRLFLGNLNITDMKKIYTLSFFLCFSVIAFGQYRDGGQKFVVKNNRISSASKSQLAPGDVYYEQDFDNYSDGDMTLIDNDGLTPHENVGGIGSNWNVMDGVALTTSWLIDGDKTSDNWMITPSISLGTEPYLSWEGYSYDSDYPDGYEVLISTTGNDISDFTTVLFSVDAEAAVWTKHLVDLSNYANQDVYLAFHHNSTDMFVLAVDNILVSHLIDFDISLDSYQLEKYIKTDGIADLSLTIENNGIETLNSVELNYQVDDNPVQTVLVDNLELTYGNSLITIHDDPISFSEPGKYDIKVWLSNPNGGSDSNTDNDTIAGHFYVVSSTFEKTVLLEEFTGTWCGWCPDGFVVLENLLETRDDLIGVCLHSGDIMATAETAEVANTFETFYPGASVDRYMLSSDGVILDRGNWESGVIQRSSMAVPVDVDFALSYNSVTQEIVIDASAQFSQEMTEDFRFNCYVVEDNIDEDGAAYDQQNYFSQNDNYPVHPYYNEPEVMTDFVHNHVVREMLGGAWGAEGSIPETVTAGETYTHQFTYSIPEDFNAEHISIVVVVQEYNPDYNKREIHNAKEHKLNVGSIALYTEDGTLIDEGETIQVNGLPSEIEFGVELLVQNIASTTTTIGVEKELIEEVPGTTNNFCWAGTCYPFTAMVSTSNAVMGPDSITSDFRADIAPDGNAGVHKMRYTFFNADDSKDYSSVYVVFNIADAVGIEQGNASDLKVWPNPVHANEVLSVDLSASKEKYHSVKLFDNTGRLLLDQAIDTGSVKLEIQLGQYQLSAGTYYILLNSDKGTMAQPVIVVQ